jgi:hypothetical protein
VPRVRPSLDGEGDMRTPCTHGQRWEHWIPMFHQIESGKVVCGSERDVFETDPDRSPCACPQDCECRR